MSLRIALATIPEDDIASQDASTAFAARAARETALAVERSCRENGWHVARVASGWYTPDYLLTLISQEEVDVVFHLVGSVRGHARFEAAAAWQFEWAQFPYTGSGPVALTVAQEKPILRAVLASRGVAIPEGFTMERADDAIPLELTGRRWIVKPAHENASRGIDRESVVDDEDALRARVDHVIDTFRRPALVEEFLAGREVHVGLLGTGAEADVLPLGEIEYARLDPLHPPLLTHAAKWDETSFEYHAISSIGARPMARELEASIRDTALAAYAAVGLAGYGRVDLRVDARGVPRVIDVNPNPDLSPDAGFAKAAARAGIDHARLVRRIVDEALERA